MRFSRRNVATDPWMVKKSTEAANLDSVPPGFVALTIANRAFSLATDVVWALCFLGLAYYAYQSIKALAGQTTAAKFVLGYLTDAQGGASTKPWIVTTIAAIVWGFLERWLRRRKVGSMSKRSKDLEKLFDAKRTSSGLTKTGQVPRHNGDEHE